MKFDGERPLIPSSPAQVCKAINKAKNGHPYNHCENNHQIDRWKTDKPSTAK